MSTTPTRPLVEIQIDGEWVDITEDVRLESADSGGGLRVKRGRPNEAPIAETTELDFVINNSHGKWSDQNPVGPYYGLIARNQPVRASLDPIDDDFNRTASNSWGSTPSYTDTENVVQAGDTWNMLHTSTRYNVTPGLATIQSTTGHTIASFGAYADVDLMTRVKVSDRTSEFGIILRATNPVAAHYKAYIFPDTTDMLRIGKTVASGALATQTVSPVGNIVADTWYWMHAQIAGQRIRVKIWADGDPEPEAWGLTFHDNLSPVQDYSPQTGEVGLFVRNGTALGTFSSFRVRKWLAHTEVVSFPQSYDLARVDHWVRMQTRGILRRLGQGRKALDGAITLHLGQYASLSAMWLSLESGTENTTGNRVLHGPPGQIGDATFAEPSLTGTNALPGATGIIQLTETTSKLTGTALPYTSTGAWTVLLFFRLPTTPASEAELFRFLTTGTARTWIITLDSSRGMHVKAYDSVGTVIDDQYVLLYDTADTGKWLAATLYIFQDGANVDWAFNYTVVGSGSFFTANGTYAGTIGSFRTFQHKGNAVLTTAGGIEITQLFHYAGDLPFVTDAFSKAASAYDGELTTVRFQRTCTDASIRSSLYGASSGGTEMGPQLPIKRLEILSDCGNVDHGMVREDRDDFGLELVTRASLYNSQVIEWDIEAGHLTEPLEAAPDDQATRNDVTVSRPNGGFAVSIQESGPLNVNEPEDDPDGVGTYDEGPQINLGTEALLQSAADWRRSLGTIPDPRYPQIKADLTSTAYQASPALAALAASIDSGWMLDISNGEVSPNVLRQLVQSYEMQIDQYDFDIAWTTSPGPIYTVGVVGLTTRVQPEGIELAAEFEVGTDTAMSTQVSDSTFGRWVPTATDPDVDNFDIMVAGVRFHVTNISGSTDPQTVTVDVAPTNMVPTTANLVIGTGSRVTLAEPWHVAW